MRAASVQLQARLNVDATTLCRLWRVTRQDGTILRWTDAVNPVTIQIDPDVSEEVYRSDLSFTSSAIFTSHSFANMQSVTLTFIMSEDGFEEADIRSRRYDGATSEIFVCDYQFPEYGTITMFTGDWGTITIGDQQAGTVEIQPSSAAVNGIGVGQEKYSMTCRASLGDARCGIDLDALMEPFTVVSASGGSFVTAELNQANAHWALGFVRWTVGANTGKTTPVQSSDGGTLSVFLMTPPFFEIQAGDEGEIFPGCDKQRRTCVDKFNNMVNMRAEPDVPNGAGVPGSNYNFNLTLAAP